MRRLAARMGVMRLMLAGLVIASVPPAFLQDASFSPTWKIVVGQVTPAVVLMVFWAIPLDILMAKIFMSEQEESVRRRYLGIIRFDIALMGILLVAWGPFFLALLS